MIAANTSSTDCTVPTVERFAIAFLKAETALVARPADAIRSFAALNDAGVHAVVASVDTFTD